MESHAVHEWVVALIVGLLSDKQMRTLTQAFDICVCYRVQFGRVIQENILLVDNLNKFLQAGCSSCQSPNYKC